MTPRPLYQFARLHGESDWLIRPVKPDGSRLTDEEIEALVKSLNEKYRRTGDGGSPLDLNQE